MKPEFKEHLDKLKDDRGKHFQGCDFGMKEFNLHKRKLLPAEIDGANAPTRGRKPPKGGGGGGGGGGGTQTDGVILLDFTGHLVTGTSWNYAGDIMCEPANLTAEQIDEIVANVAAEYAIYKVIVTTDEAVYAAAPVNRRIRLILTETWEWYGQAGGVAFINSFTWGDNTPCFVFTSLLNYNTKFIKEAASHEIGHSIGLYHQSKYDENCVKTAEYNTGNGIEAPIMGIGYYVPDPGTRWWIGPTPYGCTNIQDDHAKLGQVLGLK